MKKRYLPFIVIVVMVITMLCLGPVSAADKIKIAKIKNKHFFSHRIFKVLIHDLLSLFLSAMAFD